MQIGLGYLGSSDVKVSQANEEILPLRENGKRYIFYKFSFMNQQDVHVKINDGEILFLGAKQGFNSDHHDRYITSFIIVDANVDYNWVGAYK